MEKKKRIILVYAYIPQHFALLACAFRIISPANVSNESKQSLVLRSSWLPTVVSRHPCDLSCVYPVYYSLKLCFLKKAVLTSEINYSKPWVTILLLITNSTIRDSLKNLYRIPENRNLSHHQRLFLETMSILILILSH